MHLSCGRRGGGGAVGGAGEIAVIPTALMVDLLIFTVI